MIKTKRLLLRQWKESDYAPFATMNADPLVMEHFPASLSRAQSDALADRCKAEIAEKGYGFFAVEVPGVAPFIGFIGIHHSPIPKPCVEIGWRLAAPFWGCGYATEGALAALAFGLKRFDTIHSFTALQNKRSIALMERIGLTKEGEFDHPKLPGHRLERHVLYSTSSMSKARKSETASGKEK